MKEKQANCKLYIIAISFGIFLFIAIALGLGFLWWIIFGVVSGAIGELLANRFCSDSSKAIKSNNNRSKIIFLAIPIAVVSIAIADLIFGLIAAIIIIFILWMLLQKGKRIDQTRNK